jgi:hypothetical protein
MQITTLPVRSCKDATVSYYDNPLFSSTPTYSSSLHSLQLLVQPSCAEANNFSLCSVARHLGENEIILFLYFT